MRGKHLSFFFCKLIIETRNSKWIMDFSNGHMIYGCQIIWLKKKNKFKIRVVGGYLCLFLISMWQSSGHFWFLHENINRWLGPNVVWFFASGLKTHTSRFSLIFFSIRKIMNFKCWHDWYLHSNGYKAIQNAINSMFSVGS